MIHPDLIEDVREPVQRATDRLRVLAPVVDEALRRRYGPNWRERLREQDRRAKRHTSGLYDPRYLLRLIAHEPALATSSTQMRAARREVSAPWPTSSLTAITGASGRPIA